jgi:hypothetical protein
MTDNTFEKVQRSDQCMYGSRKLLLCGFSTEAQEKFKDVLKLAGLEDIPVVWANAGNEDETLEVLLGRSDGSGMGLASTLPRAIVVSGITQNQLHVLMTTCRQRGMRSALWAALTPTSETWPLKRLLAELDAERRALSGQRDN